ncbi:T9SS-dependent choice-of-anchor J family protein [Lacinutrix jangbogonensis]|uniref:T9SS-dependent choice-of-anchor J family protein n=1 Tax=Lacinutrix jangbogonensis TaxID=1469557 RepID=UPI00053DDEF4|nr:choice-of-anchor J domain-containing protein [Lacinutrix jangbogonensis]
MKKITLLLSFLLVLQVQAQLTEDFEGSITIPTGWTSFIGTNGEGAVQNWQVNDGTTNNLAFVTWEAVTTSAEDWLVSPQFTVSATNFILSFDQSDSFAADYGSTYTIRVSTASQTTHADFTTVDTQTETDVWSGGPLSQHTVDLTAYIGQPIYVAFVLEQNNGDRWILDNIDMIANASAPDPVSTPTPADMAIDVPLDAANTNAVALAWVAAATGDAATAYDIYFGDSATTLTLLGSLGSTSVNITGNTYDTEYFWQVVAKNVGGLAVNSPVWSFRTEMDPSLSVTEFENSSFSVFPNPVINELTIKTELEIENVKVYNQLGQEVLNFKKNSITNNTINIGDLNSGIYIINITSDNKTETIKIIKK